MPRRWKSFSMGGGIHSWMTQHHGCPFSTGSLFNRGAPAAVFTTVLANDEIWMVCQSAAPLRQKDIIA